MGGSLGSEFKFSYPDVIILMATGGFVIDSWFWLLSYNMAITIIMLIVNEYAPTNLADAATNAFSNVGSPDLAIK